MAPRPPSPPGCPAGAGEPGECLQLHPGCFTGSSGQGRGSVMGSEQHRQGQKPAGAAGRPPAAGSPILRQLRCSPDPPPHQTQILQKPGRTPSKQPLVPHVVLVKLLEKSPPARLGSGPHPRCAGAAGARACGSGWKRCVLLNADSEMSTFIHGAVTARPRGLGALCSRELRHPWLHPARTPNPEPRTPNPNRRRGSGSAGPSRWGGKMPHSGLQEAAPAFFPGGKPRGPAGSAFTLLLSLAPKTLQPTSSF